MRKNTAVLKTNVDEPTPYSLYLYTKNKASIACKQQTHFRLLREATNGNASCCLQARPAGPRKLIFDSSLPLLSQSLDEQASLNFSSRSTLKGGVVLPIMVYTEGYHFQISEGIWKARVGKSETHSMAVKKSRKCSGSVIYSYFVDSAFTAVKRSAELTMHVKG